ncbi:MAG: ABC transporter substrate-binding protein [Syntrophorhabdales bacterium]|jgi:ABC-type Fe3+-hydroxamate transport system substrate-binding protein
MTKMTAHPREFVWFAPFLCIGLMAVSLLRPLPHFPVPPHSRTVVDGGGTPVQIALPFRGTALTWGVNVAEYLEDTHAPETLLKAGGPFFDRPWFAKQVASRIYPQVLKRDSIWDASGVSHSRGSNAEIETHFAFDPGAYLGAAWGAVPLMRRVGIPALYVAAHTKNWDEYIFSFARVATALIGQPGRGEVLIARYRQAYVDLDQELHASSLTSRPRVLIMGSSRRNRGWLPLKSIKNSYQIYLPPAGVANGSEGWTGEQQDAERILAMDPDIIFLVGRSDDSRPAQSPQEFMRDPRWRGLKAVHEKRVYRMPGTGPGGLAGLIFQPIWVRWMAEIAHPDGMEPRTRHVLRERLMIEFGYRLTDDQIDVLLWMEENKGSAGYERFSRNYVANDGKDPAQ